MQLRSTVYADNCVDAGQRGKIQRVFWSTGRNAVVWQDREIAFVIIDTIVLCLRIDCNLVGCLCMHRG